MRCNLILEVMDDVLSLKIQKVEHHVNEVLKKDLGYIFLICNFRKVLSAGDSIYAEISQYLELKNILVKLKEIDIKENYLKTKVDIGCNVYIKGIM